MAGRHPGRHSPRDRLVQRRGPGHGRRACLPAGPPGLPGQGGVRTLHHLLPSQPARPGPRWIRGGDVAGTARRDRSPDRHQPPLSRDVAWGAAAGGSHAGPHHRRRRLPHGNDDRRDPAPHVLARVHSGARMGGAARPHPRPGRAGRVRAPALPCAPCSSASWPRCRWPQVCGWTKRPAPRPPASPASCSASTWVALSIATATSLGVIYGLRQEVSEARQLGQYTLEEKIGEGGMGVVYRARHAMLRRPTAIKLLRPDKAGERRRVAPLRARGAAHRAAHPPEHRRHLRLRAHAGRRLLLRDGVPRRDRPRGRSCASRAASRPAASCTSSPGRGALGEAHGSGLIHRDIKPANIILCERGGVPDVAKVVDFGLVKDLEAGVQRRPHARHRRSRARRCTWRRRRSAIRRRWTARSDLYALGAVGYYLLTGTPCSRAGRWSRSAATTCTRARSRPRAAGRRAAGARGRPAGLPREGPGAAAADRGRGVHAPGHVRGRGGVGARDGPREWWRQHGERIRGLAWGDGRPTVTSGQTLSMELSARAAGRLLFLQPFFPASRPIVHGGALSFRVRPPCLPRDRSHRARATSAGDVPVQGRADHGGRGGGGWEGPARHRTHREDFVLEEDGRPQPIVSFEAVRWKNRPRRSPARRRGGHERGREGEARPRLRDRPRRSRHGARRRRGGEARRRGVPHAVAAQRRRGDPGHHQRRCLVERAHPGGPRRPAGGGGPAARAHRECVHRLRLHVGLRGLLDREPG